MQMNSAELHMLGSYRFDGKFYNEFPTDEKAFEEANTYHDDRAATIEKWFGPIKGWCPHSDPVYHPQFYSGEKNGGWIYNNQLIER